MSDDLDPRELIAAAALDAVTAEERAELMAALADDPAALAELRAFQDVAAELALAIEPVEPSPEVGRSILDAIAAMPQRAPLASTEPVVPEASAPPAHGAAAATPDDRLTGVAHRVPRRRRRGVLAGAVAVIVAAAAAIVGIVVVQANRAPTGYERIVQASDVAQQSASLTGGGTIRVTWSHDAGLSAVHLDDAPALASGHVYELWYVTADGAAHAAGLMPTGDDGWVTLDGSLQEGAAVAITVEPAGGSEQPTTTPLAAVATA